MPYLRHTPIFMKGGNYIIMPFMHNTNTYKVTNIFAVLGKPGAGKTIVVNKILDDEDFIKKCKLKRLVYGTTRPPNDTEIDGVDYNFKTLDEYNKLDQKTIIESRSYENYMNANDIYYYYTTTSDIELGNNYICKMDFMQYYDITKWTTIKQLETVSKIYTSPVVLQSHLNVRLKRLTEKYDNDKLYFVCQQILSENCDLNEIKKSSPLLLDRMSPSCLFINNSNCTVDEEVEQVKAFIIKRLENNNI